MNRRRARLNLGRSIAVGLFSALVASLASAQDSAPGLLEIAQAFGFETEQVQALRAGETVVGELAANSDNELALSLAMLSSRDLAWHWDRLKAASTSDPTVHATGELVGDGRAALEEFELPPEELDRLAELEPGEDANFSTREYERLAAAAASDDAEARRSSLQSAMREILAERLADLFKDGLNDITIVDQAGEHG